MPSPIGPSRFAPVDDTALKSKTAELKGEAARVDESINSLGQFDTARGGRVLTVFDWSQKAAEIWQGLNNGVRREILNAVCLDRTLSNVSLVTEKRKPFDVFAKRPEIENSRGDRI